MLTKRQNECLQFLIRYMREQGGVSPTMPEIAEGMDIASKSAVFKMLDALEERGFIRRLPHRVRAIEILKTSTAANIPIFDADTHQLRGYLP